jgi:hypothetical protein
MRVTVARATRAAGVLGVAALSLFVAPAPASACDVSYEYKPSFDLSKPGFGFGGDECSTGESLVGVLLFAIAAVALVAVLGSRALRRGEAAAAALPGGTEATLGTYLHAAGLQTPPTPPGPPPPPGSPGSP